MDRTWTSDGIQRGMPVVCLRIKIERDRRLNKINKLSKNDFRFVEKLLYEQRSHDTAIMMLEGELEDLLATLIPASSASVVDMTSSKSGERYSQPEAYIIRQEENLQVKYLRGRIAERKRHRAAIAAAIEALNEEESQFVFLRYHEGNSHNVCARGLHMWSAADSRPTGTYWRKRKQVVAKVAEFVGLV